MKGMDGTIPESCWKYSGQEHATPEFERKKLDQLLQDAEKGIFDAVIVCDVSRWSRDNLKSKQGLEILSANGIKFFVGVMEHDLFDPQHQLILGMGVEMNQYFAGMQAQKSIINRINKAKKGIPTSGSLPVGRTYNKKTGEWGIDEEKHKIIKAAAERYLNGESIPVIASSYGIGASSLYENLTKRCGTQWECQFTNKRLNIDETVMMEVPALLDQKTIDAIHERVHINTTFVRGNREHNYLLSGFVYCARCDYSLGGFTGNGRSRYRHSEFVDCGWHKNVSAYELENNVLLQLVQTFGDREKIEAAIHRATPDLEKIEGLDNENAELSKNLKKVISQKDQIIDIVAEGIISKEEVKRKMDKLREQEVNIKDRLTAIETELSNIPDMNRVRKSSYFVGRIISKAVKKNPRIIFKKDFKWKRRLVEHAFGGVDNTGKRLGVYVDYVDKRWSFEVRGLFESTVKSLPLSDYELVEAFRLDSDYMDVKKELETIKSNMAGENLPEPSLITE